MNHSGRLYRITFAVFGPADAGPYTEAVPPPAPRLRNARGRLLSARKIAKLRSAEALAKLSVGQPFGESAYPV